ncbi:MAG: lipopolysaccharide biosynthesis protein [Candidatus Saccharibacteria bacterium]|nr:lipopolysaccharide biosynthesis protein [Candidatus Saccharibacteria bacterium]
MQENNLYDLVKHYIRMWYVVVALTAVGLIGGFIYSNYIQTPLYKSNVKLILVSSENVATANDQTRINNYIELIKSRRVLDPVIAKQHNGISYDEVSQAIDVTNEKNTQVINVVVATPDSQQSMVIANNITASFKAAVSKLYGVNDVMIVDPAVKATTPYNVNKPIQIAVAGIAGFVLSVVGLFFVYDIKPRNKTKQVAISEPTIVIEKKVVAKKKKKNKKIRRSLSLKPLYTRSINAAGNGANAIKKLVVSAQMSAKARVATKPKKLTKPTKLSKTAKPTKVAKTRKVSRVSKASKLPKVTKSVKRA